MLILRNPALVLGAVAILAMAPLHSDSATLTAQDVTSISVTAGESSPAAKAALTAAMILAGATGAQVIQTPEDWPRSVGGFGKRAADQTGFYVVQTLTFRGVESLTDYRPDAVLCPRSRLLSCSVVSTFTAFNRVGERRANWPMITSIVVGTGASLLWRPEGGDNRKSWNLVATRLSIGFGGYVAERFVVDWWAQRGQ